jgi:hypothetical protein
MNECAHCHQDAAIGKASNRAKGKRSFTSADAARRLVYLLVSLEIARPNTLWHRDPWATFEESPPGFRETVRIPGDPFPTLHARKVASAVLEATARFQ